MKFIFKTLIHLYRLTLSPLFGNCCRFEPTCSAYALQMLEEQNFLKASWLILKRLVKCNALYKEKT